MKKSIIYLGLVALSFTNNIVANELKEQNVDIQQDLNARVFENVLKENKISSYNHNLSVNSDLNYISDTAFFDPNTVINTGYNKSVEEIITENKLVIENKEEIYQPISLEKTIEDSVNENNQIIESDISNEVYPLDFEIINRTIQLIKSTNNATIIIDLKL
jgi:hypothetical protein